MEPTYVLLRPSGYCFRYQVPLNIKPLVGKSEIRYTLNTHQRSVAKSRARLVAGNIQQLIRFIRKNPGAMTQKLTKDLIDSLIAKYVSNELEQDEIQRIMGEGIYSSPKKTDSTYLALEHRQLMEDSFFMQTRKEILSEGNHGLTTQRVNDFLQANEVDYDHQSFEYKLLRKGGRRHF